MSSELVYILSLKKVGKETNFTVFSTSSFCGGANWRRRQWKFVERGRTTTNLPLFNTINFVQTAQWPCLRWCRVYKFCRSKALQTKNKNIKPFSPPLEAREVPAPKTRRGDRLGPYHSCTLKRIRIRYTVSPLRRCKFGWDPWAKSP